jgi:hypothetical protein
MASIQTWHMLISVEAPFVSFSGNCSVSKRNVLVSRDLSSGRQSALHIIWWIFNSPRNSNSINLNHTPIVNELCVGLLSLVSYLCCWRSVKQFLGNFGNLLKLCHVKRR